MSIIAFDLGGTKLSNAVFSANGELVHEASALLPPEKGSAVGTLIETTARQLIAQYAATDPVTGIGICVPGIYRSQKKTVWAPNIPGWEDYPLWEQISQIAPDIQTQIDSDRACCILGEVWKGNAKACADAIFMTVGTGIGAGILSGGQIIRGASDIAGAIGWMALEPPFKDEYIACGCYEQTASGDGVAKTALKFLREARERDDKRQAGKSPASLLDQYDPGSLRAHHVFEAYKQGDPIATAVISKLIQYWGMATANLVSIFNPQKIIFGGGVFGPATGLLDQIYAEACLWAQPISIREVAFVASGLDGKAGLYGAASLVWKR